MRTFGLSEFLFILQAAQWTLALSAIAFVGGALLGLVVALSRTSENAVARNVARVFIQVFHPAAIRLLSSGSHAAIAAEWPASTILSCQRQLS